MLITTAVAVGVAGDAGLLGVVLPAVPPPGAELDPGGVAVVVVPGAVLPPAVEGVLPLTRFVFVEFAAESLKPPEPLHPTIAPSKNIV